MEELAKLEEERGNPAYLPLGDRGTKDYGERIASNEMCTFFDIEYFFLAIYTSEYDCVQAAVWQCKPSGNYCAGDFSNVCEHVGSGGVL